LKSLQGWLHDENPKMTVDDVFWGWLIVLAIGFKAVGFAIRDIRRHR